MAQSTAERYPLQQGAARGSTTRQPLTIAGMVGPQRHPDQHGFRRGDHHAIVNDREQRARFFNHVGALVLDLPALARGQGGDREWTRQNTDTPPGLYLSGQVYRDYEQNVTGNGGAIHRAYGWLSIDLVELEAQESRWKRAGIMVHGGGTALGWPGAWAPQQQLLPTFGCVRMHNADLQRLVLPLLAKGRIFWSVYQEAPAG